MRPSHSRGCSCRPGPSHVGPAGLPFTTGRTRPMSPFSWLARPLSRFWNWLWLDRADRLPDAVRPAPARGSKRRDTQVRVEGLENRETPQDMFGVLQGGVLFGGLPLLGGQKTPQAVLLGGWG